MAEQPRLPRSDSRTEWSEATVENVLERYGVDDVATVFRAGNVGRGASALSGEAAEPPAAGLPAEANRAVYVPSFSSDEMVERLQRPWDVEPGYSKTAIVNAVTHKAYVAA